jgi:hypothetical protein
MFKKYLPYIFLLASVLLLLFIKKNQRGSSVVKNKTEQTDTRITVPAILPADSGKESIDGFNRKTSHLIYSKHAKCRMDCRHIDESEVKEILEKGEINYSKIETDEKGKTFPLEGVTHDKQHVRIVFAPKNDALVVVTVIDLDTEWSCDCK